MIPSTPAGSSDPASSWSGHGGIVQVVDLHAAEHSWEVSPGAAVHGYGFNGQVPGPVIEATVGDRLLVQFSNGMDQPSALVWESPSVAATPLSTSAPHWVRPRRKPPVRAHSHPAGRLLVLGDLAAAHAEHAGRACTGCCWSQVRPNPLSMRSGSWSSTTPSSTPPTETRRSMRHP